MEVHVFHPFELAFVGHSNVGKTTLITKILQALTPKYRVGYVKHDSHSFTMDHEGKDTYRAWEAGASQVLINDCNHAAMLSREHQTTGMIDCDFVFVEGYKNSSMDKVVMGDETMTLDNVVAFVGTKKRPSLDRPYFHRDDVEGLVAFLLKHFQSRAPLYGLVLSGGFSTRMQRDKGLLNYHGKPQADHCYHLLLDHCEKVYVSTRQDQWDDNTLTHLPQLHDRFLNMGPLSGILTAMTTYPHAAWIVLACDLPFVTEAVLSNLVAKRNPFKMATAYLKTFPEPLCSIYEPKSVIRLLEAVATGCYCPKKVLANIPIQELALPDLRALDNINTKAEYSEVLHG